MSTGTDKMTRSSVSVGMYMYWSASTAHSHTITDDLFVHFIEYFGLHVVHTNVYEWSAGFVAWFTRTKTHTYTNQYKHKPSPVVLGSQRVVKTCQKKYHLTQSTVIHLFVERIHLSSINNWDFDSHCIQLFVQKFESFSHQTFIYCFCCVFEC